MRVIVIEEKDAQELLDKLKLETMNRHDFHVAQLQDAGVGNARALVDQAVKEIHRAFHHRVTRWLNEQGATGLHS